MIIVYRTSADGPYKTFESGNMTAAQIDDKVGSINWYGSDKKPPKRRSPKPRHLGKNM